MSKIIVKVAEGTITFEDDDKVYHKIATNYGCLQVEIWSKQMPELGGYVVAVWPKDRWYKAEAVE